MKKRSSADSRESDSTPRSAKSLESDPPPSRADRVEENLRAMGDRGRKLLREPRGLPREAEGLFRSWFRRVWELRGGGLYAVGFAITFLFLEIRELIFDDIPTFFAMNSFAAGELFAFMVDFLIDTLMNTIAAFMWPVYVLQWWPPVGVFSLAAAFALFPRYCKPTVERWLFEEKEIPSDTEQNH